MNIPFQFHVKSAEQANDCSRVKLPEKESGDESPHSKAQQNTSEQPSSAGSATLADNHSYCECLKLGHSMAWFGCAVFLGSVDFADFSVGSDYVGCYRIDVAIIVMTGQLCRISTWGGGKAGAIGPRCGQPGRIKEDPRQGAGRENMLVLSRKTSERILIGDDVAITIVRIGPNSVRIGIEAPKTMNIVREELCNFSDKKPDNHDIVVPAS